MNAFVRFLTAITAMSLCLCASAQNQAYKYVEAKELTLVGNLFPDTPNPYHRIDTVKYKGFTDKENRQVRESSGLAVAFCTDSKSIKVKSDLDIHYGGTTGPNACGGFDLYIKRDGRWVWASCTRGSDNPEEPIGIISDMDGTMHECLIYFPTLSEVFSMRVGVESGASIEALPNPFRHRVAVFGSSFTQGISTSRSAMAYPQQLSRMTGIQFINMGCSGNCKLQPYFAEALKDADVDAFLFDSFSNPSPSLIEARLFPFIETLQAAKPDVPLIFQRTIYRERRNFNTHTEEYESGRQHLVDSLMAIACKKYDNVYYVTTTDASSKTHETSVDGTHPGDYGYTLWAESIRKPVLKILRKYGIR